MERDNYWYKLNQRLSRRRLLAGGAAVGAATIAASACGGGGGGGEGEATAEAKPGEQPPLTKVSTRGGTLRAFGYDPLAIDSRDPHHTRLGPQYNVQSAIYSKILMYEDELKQDMVPDLSASPDGNGPGMPELVDKQTYIVRIRKNATFHDTPEIRAKFPNTAGRRVTPEDVKFSIERQTSTTSPKRALYYRGYQWQTVDKIEIVDDHTLKITTKKPCSPFLHFMADRNNFILPRELIDEATDELQADPACGSGPFILDKFETLNIMRLRRNPAWHAANDFAAERGPDRPYLDFVEIRWTPENDTLQETAFKTKQIDTVGFTDQSNLYRVRDELKVPMSEIGTSGGLASSFLIDRPPFKDVRIRKAVNQALDRVALGEQMFPAAPGHPRFMLSGPICWPIVRWALPQEKLATYPGYRFKPDEREADKKEARQLFEAAGGTAGVGPIKIIFSNIPNTIVTKALPQVKRQLEEVLGAQVETTIDTTGYTQIIACLSRAIAGESGEGCTFTWSYDNGFTDMDDWLWAYYHTGGGLNAFPLSDPQIDAWLDQSREEFEYEKRRDLAWKIQDRLLTEILAGARYMNDIGRSLRWPYLKNPRSWPWFGVAYWYANVWLDTSDPTYSGRPS